MNRSLLIIALALITACGDPTAGAKPRGDPFTVIVTHAHFTDTLVQQYNFFAMVFDHGATSPFEVTWGGIDSTQSANGFTTCFSMGADSLGSRLAYFELRSAFPSAVGDTLQSDTLDIAAIPSADSANGYGQTYNKPYYWHWYIANDSNVVRGDTTRFQITPDPATICRF